MIYTAVKEILKVMIWVHNFNSASSIYEHNEKLPAYILQFSFIFNGVYLSEDEINLLDTSGARKLTTTVARFPSHLRLAKELVVYIINSSQVRR